MNKIEVTLSVEDILEALYNHITNKVPIDASYQTTSFFVKDNTGSTFLPKEGKVTFELK